MQNVVTETPIDAVALNREFVNEVELIVPRETGPSRDPEPELLAHYLAVTRALRGLVQETDHLLVVGVDLQLNRVNLWAGQQIPFYPFFREEYPGSLNRDDCIQMVRNIGRQMGLVYDEEAVDFIVEVSGGHPFLTQQWCSTTYPDRGPGCCRCHHANPDASCALPTSHSNTQASSQ
ncbi:hypothetical protein NKDENANG_03716 [Candidatus Entotheonellaceae bacterium PAL068K]